MTANLWKYIDRVLSSYWFVPSIMVASALLLSFLTVWLDTVMEPDWLGNAGMLLTHEASGARAVLSAIAGSMITVAGVTFSMTIVTVSHAASQYGPRLIGNFLRDRGNQVTLGVFVATFVYCLMILRSVRDGAGSDASDLAFIPQISLLVAIIMALLCVSFLVYFFHHIAESINIGSLISRLGHLMTVSLDWCYATHRIEPTAENISPHFENSEAAPVRDKYDLACPATGYVLTIDRQALYKIALKHDVIFKLHKRQGDFILEQDVFMTVHAAEAIEENLRKEIMASIAVSAARGSKQDFLFLVQQFVEIIGRAMSPGVNDPFTAVACINRLLPLLLNIDQQARPPQFKNPRGETCVTPEIIDLCEMLDAVFERSCQYLATDSITTIRSLEVLACIGQYSQSKKVAEHVVKLAQQLADTAVENLVCAADHAKILVALEAVKKGSAD